MDRAEGSYFLGSVRVLGQPVVEIGGVGGGLDRGDAEGFQAKPPGGLVKNFDGV
jgi:hypothetical protein